MPRVLKKIELNGFKSFANRSVLEFSGGITAIVGPNGSGKSNVVDAIRWILGEREVKNLRGAKSEDLIFAGTATKPRSSKAEVALFLDNTGKIFPLDFADVVVARSLDRGGVSQYTVNGDEIRLKNLLEMMAKARIGSRGMTIIGQGNSDMFIKASPKERREMIEEIIGLKEFQIKKTSAENKLKITIINLEQAKALAEEILPHLRSLKRQTSRLEKRNDIEKELRELENNFFGKKLKILNKEIVSDEQEIKKYNDIILKIEEEKNILSKQLEKLESSKPAEQEKLAQLRKAKNDIFENKIKIQREIGALEAELKISESNKTAELLPDPRIMFETLKSIHSLLEKNVDDIENLKSVVIQVIDKIKKILDLKQKEHSNEGEIEKRLKILNDNLVNLDKKINELTTEEKLLESNESEFYGKFKSIIEQINKLKDEIDEKLSAKREFEFKKERAFIQKEEIRHQLSNFDRGIEEFENIAITDDVISGIDLDATEKRILRLRGELSTLETIDESLIKEAKETEARYEFLKKQTEDLEAAVHDLKLLIKDLNRTIKEKFELSMKQISEEFSRFFGLMFPGGKAAFKIKYPDVLELKPELNDSEKGEEEVKDNIKTLEAVENFVDNESRDDIGIDIQLSLPRKKINSLEALSGGERSLVGIAALFALISVSTPPFLVLDEIDAALDEKNAKRFADLIKDFAKKTQFIIVTHNRVVMEAADILYGITLATDGSSKIVSLKLSDI